MNIFNSKPLKIIGLFKWPLSAIIVLFAGKIFEWFPFLVEKIYFRGVFQLFRSIYDHTLGFIPIPMVYILFVILVYCIYLFLGKLVRLKKDKNYSNIILSSLNFISIVVICFYFFWGFNYYLPGVPQTLEYTESTITNDQLYEETIRIDSFITLYRKKVIGDTSVSITEHTITRDLENILRTSQEELLSTWGYPTMGRVRIRKLKPEGILLRISTAGVYIPFVFEGHIDDGLHPIQWPFTMAHEMAHGYGITDEGECNFVGFVTCMNSGDNVIKYSAYLTYYRYLLNNLRKADIDRYADIAKNMDNVIRKDINDIIIQMQKFPDIVPEFRDIIYDSYLKSHGVHEGLASYSSIIKLIDQWKNSTDNDSLIRYTFPWLGHE